MALGEAGYWGVEADLERMYDRLTDDITTRVAEEGTALPNFEVSFPQDRYDRASLANALVARIGDRALRIEPLELQIAYKLRLGSPKDFEDALHLHEVFQEHLDTAALESYVSDFGVEEEDDELERT